MSKGGVAVGMQLWRNTEPALRQAKPRLGMKLAFKSGSTESLAGLPATVVYIWPRFRSGDYLVTLQYAEPVKLEHKFITQIDAFVSELEAAEHNDAARTSQLSWSRFWPL